MPTCQPDGARRPARTPTECRRPNQTYPSHILAIIYVSFDCATICFPWLSHVFDRVHGQIAAVEFSPVSALFLAFAFALALALIRAGMNTTKLYFDHEKLVAYQRSIQFIAWASQVLQNVPRKLAVQDQLDRASTSVPLNMAEGNAKFTAPDRCRYFDTARGSALECAACLDVLVAKGEFTPDQVRDGKALLCEVVSLLVGLIRSISPDRLGEDSASYRTSSES